MIGRWNLSVLHAALAVGWSGGTCSRSLCAPHAAPEAGSQFVRGQMLSRAGQGQGRWVNMGFHPIPRIWERGKGSLLSFCAKAPVHWPERARFLGLV